MPEVGIPNCLIPPLTSAIQETYPPTPMPSEGVYTYPYMPPPIIPNRSIAQVEANPTTLFIEALRRKFFKKHKKQQRRRIMKIR